MGKTWDFMGDGWHSRSEKEVLDEFKSSEQGLSDAEARGRLGEYGRNEIREIKRTSAFVIFLSQFKSVFVGILLFAALFSLVIRNYIDFGVILVVVIINSGVGFFQQYKAEKVIASLKKLLVPNVKVLRSGKLIEIKSSEVVPGDIIAVFEGDKIMADCRIISADELNVDEAILTGESLPILKSAGRIAFDTILAERKNMLYAGTNVVSGNARAIVVASGMKSEFGKIAGLVQSKTTPKTILEQKFDSFSKKLAVAVISLAVVAIIIGILRGEEIFNMTITGIALAVSVVPEGLPAIIALALAFAIKRMQKSNSLVRRLSAAETLGRVSVICADKTGTMTAEKMSVIEAYSGGKTFGLQNGGIYFGSEKANISDEGDLIQLLKVGILCNNARSEADGMLGDPTERALIVAAEKAGLSKKVETEKEPRAKEYSFSSKRKMMSIVRGVKGNYISYVKGAPDLIIENCSYELIHGKRVKITDSRRRQLQEVHEKMAEGALRVLGFAFGEPNSCFDQKECEEKLVFVGFQGMMDPPKKEVYEAIKECASAGIEVKMLTGDSLITARAVSRMIGLGQNGIEGKELEKMSESEFDAAVKANNIFARINPEIKLMIVKSLKRQGHIVAVTGDGVNDALALKEANIGVAMGIKGTDVARDVSDIVLLDDNFGSIVVAVKEGRKVYDNIKKSVKFHLAANAEELFVVLVALIFAMPLPMLPLAILWMNLITDSLPSLALTVEPAEDGLMQRKPIDAREDILGSLIRFIVIAGIISFAGTFALFAFFQGTDLALARTMTLTSAIFFEMFIAISCRSEKPLYEAGIFSNKYLFFSVILGIALQLVAIYTPLAGFFGLKALTLGQLGLVTLIASSGFVTFEAWKIFKDLRR